MPWRRRDPQDKVRKKRMINDALINDTEGPRCERNVVKVSLDVWLFNSMLTFVPQLFESQRLANS